MRPSPFFDRVVQLLAAAALALSAGAAVAHESLSVRRVQPAPVVTGAAARGARIPAGSVAARQMTAEELRVQKLREARQLLALPIKQAAMGAGLDINRSSSASRRKGWRAPVAVPRRGAAGALSAAFVTPPDTIRLALLRIDFLNDRGGSASSGDGRFDLSGPDTLQPPIDRAPHNKRFYDSHARALERYYDVQSFGRVVLKIDVWPAESDSAYHLSDMADLGPWAFGQGVYRAAVDMFRLMFFAADSQSTAAGQRIPWETYDRFILVHAGSDLQSDLRQDSKEDIPSFTVFLGDTDMVVFPDSAQWNLDRPIDRACFIPETINQDGYYGAINGVIAHENGHNIFGFLDVYNIDSGYPMAGYWSLMDSGNLVGSRVLLADDTEIYAVGLLPPSIDPFQRNFIGDGMDIRVPEWGDTTSISSNQRSNVFYKLPMSTEEYVLLENRYLNPADTLLQLDSDSLSKVVLGPKQPDRFEYDALLPGGGILAWHVDESVVPFEWSLRTNPDYGLNTNYARQGLQVLEADGLDDLGDPGSPYLLGSPLDPWQRSTASSLSDSTSPRLIANTGSRPHIRVDFLDDALETMRFSANRTWSLPAFPQIASFPPGGPALLAIDADGDRNLEVCWAGGDTARADSAAIFVMRASGGGLSGASPVLARLDRRPLGPLAAMVIGDPDLQTGPSLFAVTTRATDAADTLGGRVWLLDHHGAARAGWPVRLPAHATTAPIIAGIWPNVAVLVGAEDGRVYALSAAGEIVSVSPTALAGGIAGRLACTPTPPGDGLAASIPSGVVPITVPFLVSAGGGAGDVAVYSFSGLSGFAMPFVAGWPRRVGSNGFTPDFLWLKFGGEGSQAEGNCGGAGTAQPALVAHHADRLWAFCPEGGALPGWGGSFGDTIVAGLGAGDPDGDGFPEVLVQTVHSRAAFINRNGSPTPGWPRASTREDLRTSSPALSLDVDRDGRSEVVLLNGSGLLSALNTQNRAIPGWPLATGAGAAGGAVAADFDRDGHLDIVAPDRDTLLYGYSLPVALSDVVTNSWTMIGGDPARTSSLPAARTPLALAASAGPLVSGSFKAFPNPARLRPVSIAYTLSEAAQVEFRVLDASGHEVAAFLRQGERGENVVVWDPAAVPAGLYVVRVKFSGAHGSQVAKVPVGLIR